MVARYQPDRRVTKTVGSGGGTTVYVCETHGGMPGGQGSMGKTIAEYEAGDPASDPVQKYVHGKYVDEPLMLITVSASVETRHFYHQNRLYTITALTNAMGTVEERYAYTPYGEQTILNPAGGVRTSSAVYQTENVLGHQGLMHDQETNLIYNRARMLHPTLGRFMQRDPVGYIGGGSLNLYEYVKSNPICYLDSEGLAPNCPPGWTDWGEISISPSVSIINVGADECVSKNFSASGLGRTLLSVTVEICCECSAKVELSFDASARLCTRWVGWDLKGIVRTEQSASLTASGEANCTLNIY